MRHSLSLQELSSPSKVDIEEGAKRAFDLEFSKSYVRNKTPRVLQREGPILSFSKERSSSTAPYTSKKWRRTSLIGLVSFLIFCLLFYMSLRYYNTFWSHKVSDFFVILDCGSTGTRVYIYEWSFVQSNGPKGLPFVLRSLPQAPQQNYQRMETNPGFGKLVHNESGLESAINPLLQWAEKQIPENARKRTSLFLYATAGVRKLPRTDSEWLMDKAWSILMKSSFKCERDWVKTITGMEEAYYGWIALNYHMGIIGSSPDKETYGALDLGGSSLEVTFETEKNLMSEETGINLSIGEVSHHLSAYSLSGYGLNDAFDKSVAYLFNYLRTDPTKLNNEKIELMHPCLHSEYREEYMCSQCGKTMDKGGRPGMPVKLIGAPQWEKCKALAQATVNLSEWSNSSSGIDCKIHACALPDNLPLPLGKFYAMSGFFVVYRFFNLTSDSTLDDVLHTGREFCGKTWEVAKNSVRPQPFIEQYCFRAPYVVSLIRDGLHMTDDQVLIESGSITWTLGVALLEAGQAFSRETELHGYKIFQTGMNRAFLGILLLVSIVLLFCVLSYASNYMHNTFRRSYLPLFDNNNGNPTGDGRAKSPLSPRIADSEQHPLIMGGGSDQLKESSAHPLGSGHSFSLGNLGQMQFGNSKGSSFIPPFRGQKLQIRRAQSRDDLISSSSEVHIARV